MQNRQNRQIPLLSEKHKKQKMKIPVRIQKAILPVPPVPFSLAEGGDVGAGGREAKVGRQPVNSRQWLHVIAGTDSRRLDLWVHNPDICPPSDQTTIFQNPR